MADHMGEARISVSLRAIAHPLSRANHESLLPIRWREHGRSADRTGRATDNSHALCNRGSLLVIAHAEHAWCNEFLTGLDHPDPARYSLSLSHFSDDLCLFKPTLARVAALHLSRRHFYLCTSIYRLSPDRDTEQQRRATLFLHASSLAIDRCTGP